MKKEPVRIRLRAYLDRAGIEQPFRSVVIFILIMSAIMAIAVLTFWLWKVQITFAWQIVVWSIFVGVIVMYPLYVLVSAVIFFIMLDLRVAKRREQIEKVFPEYLHLVSANVRAGMTVDQALWRAVRPHFGILSKEIEYVSKETMIGHDVTYSLEKFGRKYDSKIIQRSISLIIEGINSGSEIGELLENIALNIQDIALRKESMAANVTSNSIFISFAVLVASPLLYAIANQLLVIVQTVGEKVNTGDGGSGSGITISTTAVAQSDFLVFCIMGMLATSTMSVIIISAIQTGKITDAVKSLPMYWGVPLVLFFAMRWVLGFLFASVF